MRHFLLYLAMSLNSIVLLTWSLLCSMGVSPIDVVKYAVKRLLQQYFLFGKTNDIMGIVLVGTEDTKNPIYDEDGQCANITVFKPVEKPVVDWIATVDEEIQESGASGDITDGLVVGMREIMDTIEKRKYSRRLVVITDGSSAFSMGHFDKYVEILKLENYELEVLGLNFESDEMASQMRQTIQDKVAAATGQAAGGDGEEAKGGDDGDSHADDTRSRAKRPVGAAGAGGMADAAGNSLVMVNAAGYGSSVAQQEAETHVLDKRSLETRRTTASLRTEMRLRLLAEHCGGTVYSAGALDALMNGMQTRSVGGVSKMRACLELGNASTENIAIWTYAKTSMVSLPSLSKSSALAEVRAVMRLIRSKRVLLMLLTMFTMGFSFSSLFSRRFSSYVLPIIASNCHCSCCFFYFFNAFLTYRRLGAHTPQCA